MSWLPAADPSTLWEAVGTFAATALAGGLVARVGLSFYFRQKEYETVKQRYLEQAIDLIASELELISTSFSHNWARSLNLLKVYRDVPSESFDVSELKTGFLESEPHFHRIAHHRLTSLLRSNLVWDVYQLAMSRHQSLNAKVRIEVTHAIRIHHAGRLDIDQDEFVERTFELLKPLSDQSDTFAPLLAFLQSLAQELEQSRLRFKDVAQFHERPKVVEAMARLKEAFRHELESSTNDGTV